MRKKLSCGLVLFLAACTQSATKPTAPTVAHQGPACLNLHDIAFTDIVSDEQIDFHTRDGRHFTNRLVAQCAGLRASGQYTFPPTQDRLCAGDSLTVIKTEPSPHMGAACILGGFQPENPSPELASDKMGAGKRG